MRNNKKSFDEIIDDILILKLLVNLDYLFRSSYMSV